MKEAGFGKPVTAVLVERCDVCGGDEQELAHREGGHTFVPFAWPRLTQEYRQSERWTTQGQQRLMLTGTLGSVGRRVSAKVWAWRSRPLPTEPTEPTPAEWEPLELAVQVLLAREVCPHADQNVFAAVGRHVASDPTEQDPMPPTTGFSADIRVWCADCGEPFVWVGPMQLGVNPGQPTVDVEGTTLCAPLRPLSAPEDFGLQRPGFGVRVR